MAITNANLYKRMMSDAQEFHKRMCKEDWMNEGMVWLKETDTGEMIVYSTKWRDSSKALDKAISRVLTEEAFKR